MAVPLLRPTMQRVGLFTVLSAKLMDAGRVFAIDREPSRLAKARELGAEVINFDEEDPIETLLRLTEGIGVDRATDAVGVDAVRPHRGPAAAKVPADELERERHELAPGARLDAQQWIPGDGPSLALTWAVDGVCKNGTIAVIGVHFDHRDPGWIKVELQPQAVQ